MKKVVFLSAALLVMPGCQNWLTKKPKESQKTVDAEARTHEKLVALDSSLASYKEVVGSYPATLQELIDGPESMKEWKPLTSKENFKDAWDQPFVYVREPEGAKPPYQLYSIGKKV